MYERYLEKKYLFFSTRDIEVVGTVVVVLSMLFSFSYLRFSGTGTLVGTFISFFLFFSLLFFGKFLFMKAIAYRHGFSLHLELSGLKQLGLNPWDSVERKTGGKAKQLPSPLISLLVYLFTLGMVIVPSMWKLSVEKIPHMFLGTRIGGENKMKIQYARDVTNVRIGRALFGGFLFYVFFGLFLQVLSSTFDYSFYNWMTFALYWVAFFSILPIFGTEGYDLFKRQTYYWFAALVLLTSGLTSLLVFSSFTSILTMTLLSSIIVITVLLWRHMK